MNLFKMKKHRTWALWGVVRLLLFCTSVWTQDSSATRSVSGEKGKLLVGINVQEKGILL